MDTDLQITLLELFQQVSDNPDSMPEVSMDAWQEGSMEWHVLTSFRNVLERFQQSRQDVQKSEERFSLAVQGANDGLWDWDLHTDVVYFSPRWKSMLGYEDHEIPHHFNEWLKRVHPEDRKHAQETIQDYLNGHTASYRLEHRLQHKDGTYRWILARGVMQRDKDGEPYRMAGSHTDITERKQAEEQLREKEAQYRSIFEATTDALLITDLEDGHIVEVNPAACNIYGYSYEEFIGLPPSAFIHPDKLPYYFEKALPSVKSGVQWHTRGVDVRKDGTAFPVDVHETAFTYLGKPHMLAAIRDITEQVHAEEELREKEAQYRSIFEASSDVLLIIDLEDGSFIEVNPAACEVYGYSYDEFVGLPLSVTIHPDDLPYVMEHVLPIIRAGGEYHARGIGLRKDGTTFHLDVHDTAFNYQGKLSLLAVIRDITKQVQAEEQLREKEAQYRSIFEATIDALFILDLEDGHVVEANPAACKIYGYTYEEFIGLPPYVFIHPEKLPNFLEKALPLVRAGGEWHARGINLRKDGTSFPVDVHLTSFTYQGKQHMLVVGRDVTEQVQAYELLEQRVEERTRELSTLLDISHNVASYIELKPLLATVLDQLRMIADYTGSSFSILEAEEFVLVENRGPAPLDQVLQLHIPIKRMGIIWEMFMRREPVIIPDVQVDFPLAQAFRTMMDKHLNATFGYIRSWMAVPLSHKEQIIGMLTLSSSEPDYYSPRHASLALAIANQAAVALANARLYEQAQELAALEERQRLARELHDSVSQALYGIILGTHTARTLLQRDPSKVAEPLDYVLSQAEAALTEMRALIFELRPESLETEGLIAAMSRQAAALNARHDIVVTTELCDEPDLPFKTKEELYRVIQEALHNTVKHARAKKVNISLIWEIDRLLVEVCDDGIGFDTSQSFPGHLGLHTMQERISRLSGTLRIESTKGKGTCICAQIPLPTRG